MANSVQLNNNGRDFTINQTSQIITNKNLASKNPFFCCLEELEPTEWLFFNQKYNNLRKTTFYTFIIHLVTVIISFLMVIVRRALTVIIINVVLLLLDVFGIWIFLRMMQSFFTGFVVIFYLVIIIAIGAMIGTALNSLQTSQIFIIHVPLIIDLVFMVILTVIDCKFKAYKCEVNTITKLIGKDKAKSFRYDQREILPVNNNNNNQDRIPLAVVQKNDKKNQNNQRLHYIAQPIGANPGEDEKHGELKFKELKEQQNLNMKQQAGEGIKCTICWTNPKEVCFFPCNHVCCCQVCAKDQDSCPLCRSRIAQKVRIYI